MLNFGLLVLGTILGFFSSILVDRSKNKIGYILSIINSYNRISQDIIELLTEMASLNLGFNSFSKKDIDRWRKQISYLYFKYYSFLPQEVLLEMNCLHSCLLSNGKCIFWTENNTIKMIREKDMHSEKYNDLIKNFFDDSTLVSSDDRLYKLIDTYGLNRIPCSIKINFQARRVIRKIDDYFGYKHIYKWPKELIKQTHYQRRNGKIHIK